MSDKLISKGASTQGFGNLRGLRLLCGLGVGWGGESPQLQTGGLVSGYLSHPVFSLPAVCCVLGLSCPMLPGCLHRLAAQSASFFILSHFLPLRMHKSPSLWVRSGRWGVRMGEDHP